MTELDARLDEIFAARDREHMQPTIDAFERVAAVYPDYPRAIYEVGGAYDTAGREQEAVGYYARALELGLGGELRRRCLLQYASTLRNLGRIDESLAMFDQAIAEFPGSVSLLTFKALTLHAADRPNAAIALLLSTIADHVGTAEVDRYGPSLRANAEYVGGLGDG